MSHAFAHNILQPAALSSRVGRDPDGVVDNRPGVSHPNMRRDNTVSKELSARNSRDLFCRDPQLGRDLVNSTHQTPGKHKDGKWVVGIGMRNPGQPKPKSVPKKKARPGRYASSDELWTGAFEYSESIEEDQDSKE